MSSNGGRYGPRWAAARAAVLARQTHCGICGLLVNKRLSGRHPLGPTVDHIIPVAKGGPLYALANLQLAHRRCNEQKGSSRAIPPRRGKRRPAGTPSRDW